MSTGVASAAAAALLPRVTVDSPTVVLLVELATRRVVQANPLATQLAPGVALPAPVDAWSDAAGLRDLGGEELSETDHPLSLAAQGQPARGQAVTARRASDATEIREPLFVVGVPLSDAADLDGYSLVVMLPLRDRDAVGAATDAALDAASAEAHLRDRAVLATGISFTLADAQADDFPLVWVNPAFTLNTGYSAEEAVGRNCRFLQGPATDRETVARIHAALERGSEISTTVLNYRKDGTAFWNQLSMSPVRDAEGTLTHIVAVQTDVTDQVEAERIREAALESERHAREDADRARAEADRARAEAERSAGEAAQSARDAEAALAVADSSRRQLALVAEATGLLAATLDVDESLERLTRLVVPLLADWVVIHLADENGRLSRALVRHRDGREDLLERYAALAPGGLGAEHPLQELLKGGPERLVADYQPPDRATLSPDEQDSFDVADRLGVRSLLFVPLVARRRVLGTMTFVHGSSGRRFSATDLDLAADLGRRAGLALDNARLYTLEHQTALALQKGLLPRLPEISGLALAAEYLPAAQDKQVGGDWWDVFALPDGSTGLAIGDVMGHDLSAAAAMGQLRSVLRTCAWAGASPSTVLDRMDQLVQGFDMAQLATCVYARLQPVDPAPGGRRASRLRWANAGHLPPVLLSAGGEARFLDSGTSVPLGVPIAESRQHGDICLDPGSTVLLYTDGLVETRAGDIYSDLEHLLAEVGRHRPADGPQALIDKLTADLTVLSDDVALLAVQLP
jgi:PAS domain S-box-containing protein